MKNVYVKALMGLVLLSASIHILLLVIYAAVKLDLRYLNYFNIIDIDLFIPGIEDGLLSQLLSVIVVLSVFGLICISLTKKKPSIWNRSVSKRPGKRRRNLQM